MWLGRCALGVLVGGVSVLVTSLAQAQCSKDTDCKGDRVCEAGRCVSGTATPAASAPAATAASAPAATAASAAAAAPPPAGAAAPTAAPVASNPTSVAPTEPAPPKMQRHSKGMMVGGIVMVSLAPVALLVAGTAAVGRGLCSIGTDSESTRSCSGYEPFIYGGLLSALTLVGVGVPLIVIGATKEPVDPSGLNASLSPWATQTSAGLSLRLTL
jgi:hypothetical protein